MEERIKELEKEIESVWSWASGLASIVQCLVEDRLEDEDLTEQEKENYHKLLKDI